MYMLLLNAVYTAIFVCCKIFTGIDRMIVLVRYGEHTFGIAQPLMQSDTFPIPSPPNKLGSHKSLSI